MKEIREEVGIADGKEVGAPLGGLEQKVDLQHSFYSAIESLAHQTAECSQLKGLHPRKLLKAYTSLQSDFLYWKKLQACA